MVTIITSTWMDENKNINCISGDPFYLIMEIKRSGIPLDLTNWEINLRAYNVSNETIAVFTNADCDRSYPGILIINKTAGDCEFPKGTFNYTWKMKETGKEATTWLKNKKFIVG